ncbi:MAG TPA: SHOCT domain-containing protein, partial [Gammaproteobacteria bacterium]|nr:SHOCT domain-containing protein [Gammaproteobacteria bacterium]
MNTGMGAGMWLFWIVLIVIVVLAIKFTMTDASRKEGQETDDALALVKKRYASGEIDQ